MRPRKLRRILTLTAFSAILAAPFVGGIARANPVDEYTLTNATAICQFLDQHPNVAGVEQALAEIIIEDGFTAYQGGEIVARSVVGWCPQNTPALEAFIAKYAEARMISGGIGGRVQ